MTPGELDKLIKESSQLLEDFQRLRDAFRGMRIDQRAVEFPEYCGDVVNFNLDLDQEQGGYHVNTGTTEDS
ncbi:MAG: hypothetical protein LBG04_02265 [Holosporaceae bacterium]|jgi:hypothetical protein|nr:hypothetical protein [Holosporaceae bacterium]